MPSSSAALSFAIKAVNESQAALKAAQADLQGVGDAAEKSSGHLKDKFGGAMVAAGAAGAALGAGLAIVGGRMRENEEAMADFSAKAGLSTEQTKSLGSAVNELSKSHLASQTAIAATMEGLVSLQGVSADNKEELVGLTNQYLDFATATGQDAATAVASFDDILDAWGLTAADASGIMDKLVVSHQKFGTSIDGAQAALNKYAPTFKTLGLNIDDALGFINMFAASGIDAESSAAAFTKAMDALTDSTDKGQQKLEGIAGKVGITGAAFTTFKNLGPDKQFDELAKAIGSTEDPSKRAQAAIELFGTKAGPKLAEALAGSGGDLKNFQISVGESAGASAEAADKIEGTLTNKLKILSNEVLGTLQEKLEPIAPAMLAIATVGPKVAGAIGGIAGAASTLVPELVKVSKEAVEFAEHITKAQLAVGLGIGAGVGLVASVFVLAGGMKGLTDSFHITDAAAREFAQGADVASKALVNLDAATLQKLSSQIHAAIDDMGGFSEAAEFGGETFAGMVQSAVDKGATWEQVMKLVKDSGLENIPQVQEVMNKFKDDIEATRQSAIDTGADFAKTTGGMVVAAQADMSTSGQAFLDFRTKVDQSMKDSQVSIQSLFPTIDEEFGKWTERLAKEEQDYINFQHNLETILAACVQAHIKNPEDIIAALEKAGPAVTGAMARELAQNGVEAVSANLHALSNIAGTNIHEMTNAVLAETPAFVGQMGQAGRDGVAGLTAGLEDQNERTRLTAAANALGNSIPASIRKLMQMGSPSKVMMGIGDDVVAGLVEGIRRSTPSIDYAITWMSDKLGALGTHGAQALLTGLESGGLSIDNFKRRWQTLIDATKDPQLAAAMKEFGERIVREFNAGVASVPVTPITLPTGGGTPKPPATTPPPPVYHGIWEFTPPPVDLFNDIKAGRFTKDVISRIMGIFFDWDQFRGGYKEWSGLGGTLNDLHTKLIAAGLPRSFDQGGWLMPGLTLAENRTGKPERVGGGDTYVININAIDGESVRRIVPQIMYEIQRKARSQGAVGMLV